MILLKSVENTKILILKNDLFRSRSKSTDLFEKPFSANFKNTKHYYHNLFSTDFAQLCGHYGQLNFHFCRIFHVNRPMEKCFEGCNHHAPPEVGVEYELSLHTCSREELFLPFQSIFNTTQPPH